MPLKSIFEIEIDDTKFRKFKELFDRYQNELKKLPPEWDAINKGAGETKSAVEQLVEAALKHQESVHNQTNEAKVSNSFVRSTAVVWSAVTSSVMNVETHIAKATSSLVRWSTLTAAFSGLLGAGSLFGIDRLAAAVSASRRSSMGLGITYGQQAAFDTNYNRLVNPSSLLAGVSSGAYDATSPGYLAMLNAGISPGDIASKTKEKKLGDLSVEFLEEMSRVMEGIKDKGMIGPTAQAYGFDKIMPLNDIIAYMAADAKERKQMADKFRADSKSMGLTEDAQRKWQDLTTQLDRASGRIEVTFMEKLSAIEPGLEKLSDSVVKVIDAFASSDTLGTWISELGTGLDRFASFVDTPEFQSDIETFVSGLDEAAHQIWNFIAAFSDKGSKGGSSGGGDSPAGEGSGGFSDTSSMSSGSSSGSGYASTSGPYQVYKDTSPVGNKPGDALNWMMNTFGLTKEQALGPIGWMGFESGDFNQMHQMGVNPATGDLGYAQWSGPRRRAMEAWIRANRPGLAADSPVASRAYLEYDLKTNHPDILAHLRASKNRDQSMAAWVPYEGPYGPGTYEWNMHHAKMEHYVSSGKLPTVIVRPAPGGSTTINHYLASNPSTTPQ